MKKSPPAARNGKYSEEYYYFCKEGEQNRVITRNKDMNMEPSIKDKYIILGFIFVAICMFFFAFSTIIGWYFFGQANIKYLFGPKAVKIYSVAAAVCVFLGSLAEVDLVWNMADCFNSLMVVPNILALFALSKVISQVHEDYFKNFKKKNNS